MADLPRRGLAPLGRDTELADVIAAARGGARVLVHAPAGTGKTTLARHLAHLLADQGDEVVFLDAAGHDAGDLVQDVVDACVAASGDDRPDATATATATATAASTELPEAMRGWRGCLVVDDVDATVGGPGPATLAALSDVLPEACLIVTSSAPWTDGTSLILPLGGLSLEAGTRLVERELGRPLDVAEQRIAGLTWEAVSGRPLGLVQAVEVACRNPDDRLSSVVEASRLMPVLVDRLDDAASQVLALLATLGAVAVGPEVLAAMVDRSPLDEAYRLARCGLVTASVSGHRVHDAVVAAPPAELRLSAYEVARAASHLEGWLSSLPRSVPPSLSEREWPSLPGASGPAIVRLVAQATRLGRPEVGCALARAAAPVWPSPRRGALARLLHQGAVAAEQAGDGDAQAYFRHHQHAHGLDPGRPPAAADDDAAPVPATRAAALIPPPAQAATAGPAPDDVSAVPSPSAESVPATAGSAPGDVSAVPGEPAVGAATAGPAPDDVSAVPSPSAESVPATPGGTRASAGEVLVPPLRLRLVAFAIDLVVVGLVELIALWALGSGLSLPWLVVVFVAYHTTLLWLTGTTPGKALFDLRLRRVGDRPFQRRWRSLTWVLLRTAVGYLVVDLGPVGLVVAARRSDGRPLHDVVFRSQLVVAPPPVAAGVDDRGLRGRAARVETYGGEVEAALAEVRPSSRTLALGRWLVSAAAALHFLRDKFRDLGEWIIRSLRATPSPAAAAPAPLAVAPTVAIVAASTVTAFVAGSVATGALHSPSEDETLRQWYVQEVVEPRLELIANFSQEERSCLGEAEADAMGPDGLRIAQQELRGRESDPDALIDADSMDVDLSGFADPAYADAVASCVDVSEFVVQEQAWVGGVSQDCLRSRLDDALARQYIEDKGRAATGLSTSAAFDQVQSIVRECE